MAGQRGSGIGNVGSCNSGIGNVGDGNLGIANRPRCRGRAGTFSAFMVPFGVRLDGAKSGMIWNGSAKTFGVAPGCAPPAGR